MNKLLLISDDLMSDVSFQNSKLRNVFIVITNNQNNRDWTSKIADIKSVCLLIESENWHRRLVSFPKQLKVCAEA